MSAAAGTGTRTPARLRTVALGAVTLAAAVAGVLVGGRFGAEEAPPAPAPPPPARTLTAGIASLPVPDGWSVGAPRFAVPGIRGAAGMWDAADDAMFAVLPPEHASLLPAAFVRRAGDVPEPRPVSHGWRYDFTSPDDPGRLTLLVLPSTEGVVTLACLSPGTGGTDADDACVDAAAEVRIRGGAWIPPGRETAMRLALPPAIERLDRDRTIARRALASADSTAERVRAARAVARAYAAAAELRPLAGEARARALVASLDRLDADYRRLATAHAERYPRLAVRSAAAIDRREARLDRQIAAVSRAGGG